MSSARGTGVSAGLCSTCRKVRGATPRWQAAPGVVVLSATTLLIVLALPEKTLAAGGSPTRLEIGASDGMDRRQKHQGRPALARFGLST